MLYDADCGFCTASVRVVTGRWFLARVTAAPFQSQDLPRLRLSVDNCEAALHVLAGREVHVGGAAIARILRSSRAPWPLVGRALGLPVMRWITERCYRLVARNRHRLPGGTVACELRANDVR
ncbi:DUF393 domain-containing protein [Tessaracoccus sp. HDW20]|uniref:thiol-disulfide oxidoreductase DCC family protein n=1 Tax=Tessaracoccus coleopterorum TaxID=2714950 RepID=UPI0018D492F1|nr:DUF393 domain-containing protein [Tessaracoccus coleopterorum]